MKLCLLTVNSRADKGPIKTNIVILCNHKCVINPELIAGFENYIFSKKLNFNISRIDIKGPSLPEKIEKQLQSKNPDIIFSIDHASALLARQLLPESPIFIAQIAPSVSLENTNNIRGISMEVPLAIQLDWIKRTVPNAHSVGLIYSTDLNRKKINQVLSLTKKMNLELISEQISTPQEFPQALKSVLRRADIILGLDDPVVITRETAKAILLSSFRQRIPFVGLSRKWVKSGALFSLESNDFSVGKQSGKIIEMMLKNKIHRNSSIQYPIDINYILNMKTARHMKIDISSDLIKQAEKIYE